MRWLKKKAEIDARLKQLSDQNHPLPVSRRDFISQGLLGSVGALTLVNTAFGSRAEAACPPSTPEAGLIPFLVFDCAGGAGIAGNWVPKNKNGDLLQNYNVLGLGNNFKSNGSMTTEFGAPMATQAPTTMGTRGQDASAKDFAGPILSGIKRAASDAALAKLSMGIICTSSISDSGANQQSALQWVTKAGLRGRYITNGVGMGSSGGGGNSDVPEVDSSLSPMFLNSYSSLANSLYLGPVVGAMPASVRSAFANANVDFTSLQADRFARRRMGSRLMELAVCAQRANQALINPVGNTDPRQDATMNSLYGIAPGTDEYSQDVRSATIVKAVLEGLSGAGCIVIGGCDYHGTGFDVGYNKELEIGYQIGRAVETAYRKNKPLIFQVFSDGAMSWIDNTRLPIGDDNSKAIHVVGVFSPSGQRPVRSNGQVGFFLESQDASMDPFFATDPRYTSMVVAANYLSLCGRMDLLPAVLGKDNYSLLSGKLDSILLFG